MFSRKLTAALAVSAALVAGCGSTDSGGATTADVDPTATLRYATTYGASSFDPHKTKITSDSTMLNLVYDRLVHRDIDGNPVPGHFDVDYHDGRWRIFAYDGMPAGTQFHVLVNPAQVAACDDVIFADGFGG